LKIRRFLDSVIYTYDQYLLSASVILCGGITIHSDVHNGEFG